MGQDSEAMGSSPEAQRGDVRPDWGTGADNEHVWRQGDCGDFEPSCAGLGPQEHAVRRTAEGIEPQVPDSLHPFLP